MTVGSTHRILEALSLTVDPAKEALETAPFDNEPDDDDFDGGLSEARRELLDGDLVSHDELKRELGLS